MDSAEKQNNSCLISLRGLSIGYENRPLLADVDADFRAGRLTALLGRNGSGKSTLLKAIAGLNRDFTGVIEVAGDPDLVKSPRRALTVAFVNTSRVSVANLRAVDLVAMGRAPYTNWIGRMRPDDEQIVMASLQKVGMADFARRPVSQMSDGETQRVMIARALAQSTPVILLDEPTSFLDLPNRYELCALLAALARDEQKCIIFSTHELDIAINVADDISIISNPRLITGTAGQIRRSGIISQVFGSVVDSILR